MPAFWNRWATRVATRWSNSRFEPPGQPSALPVVVIQGEDFADEASQLAWIESFVTHQLARLHEQRGFPDTSDSALLAAFSRLPNRKRLLLSLWIGEDLTCKQLARRCNVSDMQMRRELTAAITQLGEELRVAESTLQGDMK